MRALRLSKYQIMGLMLLSAVLIYGCGLTVGDAKREVNSKTAGDIFEVGGPSFDFQKISARRFGSKPSHSDTNVPFSLYIDPMNKLDNTFCLSSNDPALTTIVIRHNAKNDGNTFDRLTLAVAFPETAKVKVAFSAKDAEPTSELIDGKKYDVYRVELSHSKGRFPSSKKIFLFTSAAPIPEKMNAYCWLHDGKKIVSNYNSFGIRILPQIKIPKKPSIYMNGFMDRYINFAGIRHKDMLARFVGNTGCQWTVSHPDKEMLALYRKYGMKIITPELYWIANGYRIGKPKNKPDYAKFITVNKKIIPRATCPTAIYNKTDYFKNNVIPYINSMEKGKSFDGFWANWEPYMYSARGCFCDRCRDEFIKFSKLPVEVVKKAWPLQMLVGKKYYRKWVEFRSWQHAKMMKVIEEATDNATTGKAGFIAGVAFSTMLLDDKGVPLAKTHYGQEYRVADFGKHVKYVDPWGPYSAWNSSKPYVYTPAPNLRVFAAAKNIRSYVEKVFPNPGQRPKLLAFPQGIQLGTRWITTPEGINMDVLSFFFNRFDASTVYYFPRGYDNRYWAAMACANSAIAEYECFVFDGRKIENIEVTPITPFPSPVKKILARYVKTGDVSVLQGVSYAKDDRYLVAVGNFWVKGDVFFNLKLKGLDPEKSYTVRFPDKGLSFVKNSGEKFTGGDIAGGIKLHCGSMRWAFYVIEPEDGKNNHSKLVTPGMVDAAIKKRLPDLQAAAAFEDELARKIAEENKKSKLKRLKSGPLSCEPLEKDGGQFLRFASGKNTALLALNGMAITDWKLDRRELVAKDKSMGFGTVAFWSPSAIITSPYMVRQMKKNDSGIIIVGERKISPRESTALAGLLLRKTIRINQRCSAIEIKTTVANPADSGKTWRLGFRYHLLPLNLAEPGGGIIMMNKKEKKVFTRNFKHLVISRGKSASTEAVAKLFGAKKPLFNISESTVWLTGGGHKKISMRMNPDNLFRGFACWDGANQLTSSVEPFFEKISLKPNKSMTYTIIFK